MCTIIREEGYMEKEKFYKKMWVAVVCTIFVYPLGMLLVWTNKNIEKKIKIILTVLGGLFFVYVVASDTTAPEITLSEKEMTVYKGESASEDEIKGLVSSVTDNKTEMSVDDIVVDGYDTIDFATEGEYKINFTATDGADNEATTSATIKVELSPEEQAAKEEAEAKEKEEAEAAEKAGKENENALKTAQNYVDIMSFSEEGLRSQLDFEGFEPDQIDYAIDNVEVDYNQEAVDSATSYSETMSMSSSAIYDQLIFEGYTADQAQYGIDNY